MPNEEDPNKPKQDPPPSGMTEEDVGRIVNAAVTSQLKRLLPAAVTEAISGMKLPEMISAQVAAMKDPGEEEPTSGKPKNQPKSELEKQLQELAAKLEASEKATKEAERLRIETEQARRLDAGTTAFRTALSSKLRPELLDVGVSHWGTVQKRLTVNDDGTVLIRVKRAPYKGAPEQDEDLPLAEALPILLASEEAKPFLPPPAPIPGAGGGAPRNLQRGPDGMPRYDTPATTDEEKARRALEKENALRAQLNL